jgi:hypothetical protein
MARRTTKSWAEEAQEALRTKLRGVIDVGAIERLAVQKHNVWKRKPDQGTGFDAGLASILQDQIEGLELLARALRGELYDREALEELTMREAWRLKRTDVLAGTFDHLTVGSGSPV